MHISCKNYLAQHNALNCPAVGHATRAKPTSANERDNCSTTQCRTLPIPCLSPGMVQATTLCRDQCSSGDYNLPGHPSAPAASPAAASAAAAGIVSPAPRTQTTTWPWPAAKGRRQLATVKSAVQLRRRLLLDGRPLLEAAARGSTARMSRVRRRATGRGQLCKVTTPTRRLRRRRPEPQQPHSAGLRAVGRWRPCPRWLWRAPRRCRQASRRASAAAAASAASRQRPRRLRFQGAKRVTAREDAKLQLCKALHT